MKTEVLASNDPQVIQRALDVLVSSGLVAFPTDTIYGLGALAFDAAAIESLYLAKARPEERAIPVLLGDPDDLVKVAIDVSPMALKLASHFWPGPVTLVVPKHPLLPAVLSNQPSVGVRMPDHPVARALLCAAGPMAVTSANQSGQPGCSAADEVLNQLGGRIPLIIDGGETPGGVPSTIVRCIGPDPEILRVGPVSEEQILTVLGLG